MRYNEYQNFGINQEISQPMQSRAERYVNVLSPRAKPILVSRIQVEPFIAKSRFSPIVFVHHSQHQTPTILGNGYTRFRPDSVYSERIQSIPDGFCSFRTDAGHPRRFRYIYAFQVNLYSYAVPQQ